jgi:para-aminobenzoate synthetase component I
MTSLWQRPIEMVAVVRSSTVQDVFAFYARLRRRQPMTALLESLGEVDETTSRYCYVGVSPAEILRVERGVATLTDVTSGAVHTNVYWLDVLSRFAILGADTGDCRQTGSIGYVGYDMKNDIEILSHTIPADTCIPDVLVVRYDVVFIHDRLTSQSWWAYEPHRESVVDAFEGEERKASTAVCGPFVTLGELVPDSSREEHLHRVNRAIEYIWAGDIFQANITARFSRRCEGDAFALYARLREETPNPFFAYLDFTDPVLSTSPERFLSIRNRRIAGYPIKGTVRCVVEGKDQREALVTSAKNRAENTMIVDLMRNDIGRVSVHGSVAVEELCGVKRFNNLYHLESIVSGTLRPGVMLGEVLCATFPGGSITGAPKVRAMDIIEELESVRRGPYCGAIGFFGSQGWVDTSIAIRTMYITGGRVYFHAGGGIVADSNAPNEYDELMLKAEKIALCLDAMKGSSAFTSALHN